MPKTGSSANTGGRKRQKPSLRSQLKAMREFRAKEADGHMDDLALWLLDQDVPVGEELAIRVGMTAQGRRHGQVN